MRIACPFLASWQQRSTSAATHDVTVTSAHEEIEMKPRLKDIAVHIMYEWQMLKWTYKQLLSENWIKQALTPCDQNPQYGYMFWLNTGRALSPSAPEGSFFARGAGSNVVWIDPENDLVAVFRWILKEKIDELCGRILKALR